MRDPITGLCMHLVSTDALQWICTYRLEIPHALQNLCDPHTIKEIRISQIPLLDRNLQRKLTPQDIGRDLLKCNDEFFEKYLGLRTRPALLAPLPTPLQQAISRAWDAFRESEIDFYTGASIDADVQEIAAWALPITMRPLRVLYAPLI